MKKLTIFCIAVMLYSCSGNKAKITDWRGEQGSGIFDEKDLLKEWPAKGPEEVFYVEGIGNGYGSPAVTDEFIYVTGEVDSMAVLFCFDKNGNTSWKTVLSNEFTSYYPGSRSTPTLADDLVYTCTGTGNLFCVNALNGKIIWEKHAVNDYNALIPYFGHAESILLEGDKLYWVAGGPEKNIVALDRFTGDLVWSQKALGERSAYNSPRLIHLPGRKLVVTFTAYNLVGVDAETGELLWSHEQTNYLPSGREYGKGDTHSNSVIYDDALYYIAGDGNGGVKLEISDDGTEINEVWRNPEIDGFMGGVIKIGKVIYTCGTQKKDLKAINSDTGEILGTLKIGSGALIAADQMLYYYNQKGELMLISYDGGILKVISSFKVKKGTKEHFAHPVIHDGILYQRHGNAMMGYKVG